MRGQTTDDRRQTTEHRPDVRGCAALSGLRRVATGKLAAENPSEGSVASDLLDNESIRLIVFNFLKV